MSKLNRRNPYASIRSAAEHYWRLGLEPVPVTSNLADVPKNESGLVIWSHKRIGQDFNETDNIGLVLGPRSGDLVEVKLHWQEAGGWALELMHDLPAFCRDGVGFLNRLARVRLPTNLIQFSLPESAAHLFGPAGGVVLELKGEGHKAVVPPSLYHAGERLRWRRGYLELRYADDIPYVSPEWLIAKAGLLATMAVLYRAYPRDSPNRSLILQEMIGLLLRAGGDIQLVSDFLDQLAFNSSSWKWESRFERVQAVKAQVDEGDHVGDAGTVCRLLGIESMTATLRSWLDPFGEGFPG